MMSLPYVISDRVVLCLLGVQGCHDDVGFCQHITLIVTNGTHYISVNLRSRSALDADTQAKLIELSA